ncbi:hypothetical protein NE865_13772 [Phthorimaea operculella]|nr:hypothetical protein NE865_13772 [Phthorimaea operculella]
MLVNRSPPAKDPTMASSSSSKGELNYDSAPESGQSTRANKRRAFGSPPSPSPNQEQTPKDPIASSDVIKQMSVLFEKYSLQQDIRFGELRQDMQEQNKAIKDSIQFLSDKYDEAMTQIKALENEKKEDKKRITALQERVEFLERKSCSATIELRNVPHLNSDQNKYEGKDELTKFVQDMGEIVKVEIKDSDLKDIYRLKSQENAKSTIVAEFVTVPQKDKLLNGIKQFNKGKPAKDKLHTGHFNLSGDGSNKPIYVSESLTRKTAKLFAQAREFAKNNGYNCWSSRGAIFLRIDENKRIQIKSEKDLTNFKPA